MHAVARLATQQETRPRLQCWGKNVRKDGCADGLCYSRSVQHLQH